MAMLRLLMRSTTTRLGCNDVTAARASASASFLASCSLMEQGRPEVRSSDDHTYDHPWSTCTSRSCRPPGPPTATPRVGVGASAGAGCRLSFRRYESARAQVDESDSDSCDDNKVKQKNALEFPGGKVMFVPAMKFLPGCPEDRINCYRVLDDNGEIVSDNKVQLDHGDSSGHGCHLLRSTEAGKDLILPHLYRRGSR